MRIHPVGALIGLAIVLVVAVSAYLSVPRSVPTPETVAPPPPKERLILAFGDSLTSGYRLKPAENYPARLEAQLRAEGRPVRIHNAGVSGDTTSGGRARLTQVLDALPTTPDLVILELGANDMMSGIKPSQMEANLDAMVTQLKDRGIPVVVAGLFDPVAVGVDYFDAYNAVYPKVARKHGVVFYPFFMRGVAFNSERLLDDGLHPNAQGADVIATNILPVVRAELAKLPQT